MAHATLGEAVHPVFATVDFEGADQRTLEIIGPIYRMCADWFADAWLMKVAPDEELALIDSTFKQIYNIINSSSDLTHEMFYRCAAITALSIYWNKEKVSCNASLQQAVDAFMSVPPEKPTIQKMVQLFKLLLAPYQLSAELIEEQNYWQITHLTP